ncbi:MAG: alpha/beta hydrolase-fold protein [Sphingobacteriales bacterium]|jgi:predicted esterase
MPKGLFIFFLFLSIKVTAQEIHYFNEGLASGVVHQYGREALYTDRLAHALYSGSLKPIAGQPVLTDSTQKTWTIVKADSNHNFRSPFLGSGYLYLTYQSSKAQNALLIATGHSMVYVNGAPHAGDMYRYGWMNIPITLKKGLNEIYIRSAGMGRFASVAARLEFPSKNISILTKDPTLPFFIKGESEGTLWGGIVVRNMLSSNLNALKIEVEVAGKTESSILPTIPGMMTRKVSVRIPVPASIEKGIYLASLKLYNGNKLIDTTSISITAVNSGEHASYTFISDIDGSVQYYAVAPQTTKTSNPYLFLSVHGAEVEAISQARAYKPKAEGPIVAPTNRRPRGFNWEDWGRLDALEVLSIAEKKYNPHPKHIYLTGHSMGGHGTWYLGGTYPGKWAAIAPSAGYPTLAAYGSHDGRIPTSAASPVRQMLIRSSNPSNVLELAKNYKASGVYIFHGDADETVPVAFARQMRELLGKFHQDMSYYEYPGGSHWFSDESVDWKPLFDFFRWHKIPASDAVNEIDFTTASTAISHQYRWVKILQQQKSFMYSRAVFSRDLKKKTLIGSTENISVLDIDLSDFKAGDTINLQLDKQSFSIVRNNSSISLVNNGSWVLGALPAANEKGIVRNGGFKEPFRNRMVFVYGTKGTAEENNWALNKAKYDAETWYYRANGSVDFMSDTEYLERANMEGRGVILYGNITTNAAATVLLKDCPVKVERSKVTIGDKSWIGEDLGAYHIWPRSDNTTAVALIGGTGIKGMRAADANQYFSGGSGFPDFMIFSLDMLKQGDKAIKAAGYFNNRWELGNDWEQQ